MAMAGFKERYEIEVHTVGFGTNHLHMLRSFLPEYSEGQVVRLIKSITLGKFSVVTPVSSASPGNESDESL